MYINNIISNIDLIFLIITFLITVCGIAVITCKNPVHSILFLILTFVITAIIFLTLNVDFIAMLILVLYVGAIIVLFLFVVMMLNVRILELNERIISYIPIAISIVLIFFFLILNIITYNFLDVSQITVKDGFSGFFELIRSYLLIKEEGPNLILYLPQEMKVIILIGAVLFQDYPYLFLLAGIALLVAMLGSIVLTLNSSAKSKRQDYYLQTNKTIIKSIRHLK